MKTVRSGDAKISYEVLGKGSPVVVLHPFPVHHEFWLPAAQALLEQFTFILPDLRGHGGSEAGEGPVSMAKHVGDIARILDEEGIGRAPLAGVSIGGYALFEFWRQHRDRVSALALINTKAQADDAETRKARSQAAAEVLKSGTEQFFQNLVPILMGTSTQTSRPDLVEGALRMMRMASAERVAAILLGMAARPDSVETLKGINVPTLIVTGDEDSMTGPPEAELMHRHIAGSQMKVIHRAGHYSPWERPDEAGELLRDFFSKQI